MNEFDGGCRLLLFCPPGMEHMMEWQQNELFKFTELTPRLEVEIWRFDKSGAMLTRTGFEENETCRKVRQKFRIKDDRFTTLLLDSTGKVKFRDNRPLPANDLLSFLKAITSY